MSFKYYLWVKVREKSGVPTREPLGMDFEFLRTTGELISFFAFNLEQNQARVPSVLQPVKIPEAQNIKPP